MLLCPEILQNYREQNSGQKCAQILLSKIFGPNYGHLDESKLLIGFLKSYKEGMHFLKKVITNEFQKAWISLINVFAVALVSWEMSKSQLIFSSISVKI